jgi:hypothetical protein
MGPGEGPSSDTFKPKLYNSMESDDNSDSNKSLDKGKGIDKSVLPVYDGGTSSTQPLDKGKGIDRTVHPTYTGTNIEQATEPPFAV